MRRLFSKQFIFFCVFCVILTSALSNIAYANSNMGKVYFVDFNRVLSESKTSKQALADLKKSMETDYKTLENKKKVIDQKREELLKKAALLSASALEDKQKEIQKEERNLMLEFNDKKELYARKKSTMLRSMVTKIQKIVQDLSKKNGYEIVIQKGDAFVIYANEDYDITDDVIDLFD